MAYARFGSGSDVYLYGDSKSGWTCCMCGMNPADKDGFRDDVSLGCLKDVLTHLQKHVSAGHQVHESCMIRVQRELGEAQPRKSPAARTG